MASRDVETKRAPVDYVSSSQVGGKHFHSEPELPVANLKMEESPSHSLTNNDTENDDAHPTSPETSRLLMLPAEIRAQIYNHAGIWSFDVNSAGYLGNRRPPGILLTCKSVHHEIAERFWAGRTLYINDADYWGSAPCQCCGNHMMGVNTVERALSARLNAMGPAVNHLTKVNMLAALVCFGRLKLIFQVLSGGCLALEDADMLFGKKGSQITGRMIRLGFTYPQVIVTPTLQTKVWIEETTGALREIIERGKLKRFSVSIYLDEWEHQEEIDALWASICTAIGPGKTLKSTKDGLIYNEKPLEADAVSPHHVIPLSGKEMPCENWYVAEFRAEFKFTAKFGFGTFCSFLITQKGLICGRMQ